MAEQRVLRGHKKVGKRFIPPMKQLPGMQETGYVNDMLPELVWLGLINDRLGYVPGARFFEKIVSAAIEAAGEEPNRNYALLSQVGELNTEQRASFLHTLSTEAMLEPLRKYIAPLILLYDDCPLAFIGPPNTVYMEKDLIESIRACVDRHLDKYETPGIVLNGAMLVARLVSGTISFAADIKIPNFDAVINDPSSDEAKHAASFMRANALAEFGMLKIENTWARNFWNRNFEISECEFDYDTDD